MNYLYGKIVPLDDYILVSFKNDLCFATELLDRGWNADEIHRHLSKYSFVVKTFEDALLVVYDFKKAREIELTDKELGIRVTIKLLTT